MDCEKFDRVLMDLLYDELDELTKASATRHSDQCQRCRELLSGFKDTRESMTFPLTEPPDGFESRILEAERLVHRRLPLRQRVARAVTIATGYAMRPQLAMAALFLLLIGTSLVLLPPKAGPHGSVTVTESGVPKEDSVVVPVEEPASAAAPVMEEAPAQLAAEPEEVAKAEAARPKPEPAPAVAAAADSEAAEEELDMARSKAEDDAFGVAMNSYRAGQLLTAQKQFDEIVQARGKHAAQAELLAAQATEKALGCNEALARFDSVAASQSGEFGQTAIWHSANCRKRLGQTKRAVLDFEKLVNLPAYAARARQALAELEATGDSSPVLAEAKKPASPKAKPGASESGGAKADSKNASPDFSAKVAARKRALESAKPKSKKVPPKAAKKPAARQKKSAPALEAN